MLRDNFLTFSKTDLLQASLQLFKTLGYVSERRIVDDAGLPATFLDNYDVAKRFSPERGLFAEWQTIHLLFQLTDEEIKPIKPAFGRDSKFCVSTDNSIIESFLFIALELKKSHYSRTQLAKITRAINQIFPMPAILLFKHGELLTLSVIHRRLHQRDESKDVLEKVTLIKDIRIEEPHRAQIDILEKLSLIALNVSNFVELHRKWQKVLDISVLNKQFYQELAVLFTQLVGGERGKNRHVTALKLPSISDDKVLKEFTVRLIGRLLFCWFLQKKTSNSGKSLVPVEILSLSALQQKRSIDFYHEKLEPLFFEVLNKELKDRKVEFQQEFWAQIPFLNGGLFEPHVHDFYDGNCTLGTLIVPDDWLANLLGFFERYHFTIEENTPLEVQVAIDPEMLGQIFENLLAEINPETGETARKATGSYYTPREIVDYMVDESLVAYFSNLSGFENLTGLRALLSYASTKNPFNAEESQDLLKAIGKIKILDPACGSGAFPMGVLQKLVLMLQRLDSDCSQWLANLLKNIPDFTARQLMQEKLQGEQGLWDYTRKLGILRECIYGVDIQTIAVEISRLRCFLSLMVDEKIEENKPNLGIMPLPNLAFKFVCANTLIGLPQQGGDQIVSQVEIFEESTDTKELERLREEYFTVQNPQRKQEIQQEFENVQKKMFERFLQFNQNIQGVKSSQAQQLLSWKPFSDESCDWFDPFWMFGIKTGFDVIIGNPPYGISLSALDIVYFKQNYKLKSSETAILFIEKGYELLNTIGIQSYIIPKSFIFASNYNHARDFVEKDLFIIVDCGKVFENVKLEACIIVLQKDVTSKSYNSLKFNNPTFELVGIIDKILKKKFGFYLNGITPKEILLGEKILQNGIMLNDISQNSRGEILQKHLCKDGNFSVIGGKEIDKYRIRGIKGYLKDEQFITEKAKIKQNSILVQNIIAHIINPYEHIKIIACIPYNTNLTLADTINQITITNPEYSVKFIWCLLNSKLVNWYTYLFIFAKAIRTMHFDNTVTSRLPIPKLAETAQKPFITLVDKIFASKKQGQDTSELEQEIDKRVYQLYDLTEEEIAMVEGKT